MWPDVGCQKNGSYSRSARVREVMNLSFTTSKKHIRIFFVARYGSMESDDEDKEDNDMVHVTYQIVVHMEI